MKSVAASSSLTVVDRAVDDLAPYANNARTHSEDQVAQIAASITEFGWTNPVLIDGAGGIIAGHGRVLAARLLGMTVVPCIVLDHLTEVQRRAYVLADNKLALNAGWDEELLIAELQALSEADFKVSLTGFADDELSALLARHFSPATDPDDIPEVQTEAVSRTGDVWVLGRHRLVCGDSTVAADVEAALAGAQPHLMVTDPPYGVNYDPAWRQRAGVNNSKRMGVVENDHRADWREAWALFPGEVAYVWHGGLHAATVAESLAATGFDLRAQIIWAKPSLIMGRGHYHWQHEPCWYAVRGTGHWTGDRKQTTLWEISSRAQDAETTHSTQKPVECMKRPMENNSSPGQSVYEPFSGSGTTIIAAELTGRACRAIEIDPRYVDVAVRRWQSFATQSATLDGDGRTFQEIETERASTEAAVA